MADEGPAREGVLGWGRLGCLWIVLAVVPLWVTLMGAFSGARPAWLEDRGLTDTVVFGMTIGGWFAVFAGTSTLLVLLFLVGIGFGVGAAIGRWRRVRAERAEARRWDLVVGDGAVLRPDAWGAAAVPASEDPTEEVPVPDDATEELPTDPRVEEPTDR